MDAPRLLNNIHSRLDNDFGSECLRYFRKLEKLERNIARFRCHLHFILHCKHRNMIPRSLKLKSSVCGHKADNILCEAEKSLFSERIRQINFRISQFQNQKLDVEDFLFMRLPSDT